MTSSNLVRRDISSPYKVISPLVAVVCLVAIIASTSATTSFANNVLVEPTAVSSGSVDGMKVVLVTDTSGNGVVELNAATGIEIKEFSGIKYGIDGPVSALATGHDIWVANFQTNQLVKLIQNGRGSLTLNSRKFGFRGPQALASNGHTLFVVNLLGSSLSVINEQSDAPIKLVNLMTSGCSGPDSIAIINAQVWIGCSFSNRILVLSLSTLTPIRTLSANNYQLDQPGPIAFGEGEVVVANTQSGSLSFIRYSDSKSPSFVCSTTSGGAAPEALSYWDGEVFVADMLGGKVAYSRMDSCKPPTVLRLARGMITEPSGLADSGDLLFVTDIKKPSIIELHLKNLKVLRVIQ